MKINISKFLADTTNWLLLILSELKNHVISLFFISLLFIIFTFLPQTNDLLLVLNQPTNHSLEVIPFISSLIVLAFLISNLNDYLTPHDGTTQKKVPMDALEIAISNDNESDYLNNESEKSYIKRMLPKVLGTLLILIVAFAISHVQHEITGKYLFEIDERIGLGIGIFILLLTLSRKITCFIQKKLEKIDPKKRIPILIAMVSLGIIVLFGFLNQGGSDRDIEALFIVFILLAVFFYVVSLSYTKQILKFKSKIGIYIIGGLTVLSFLVYLYFFINPNLAQNINPLTVILISIIALFSISTSIRYLGKLINLPLLPILLILFVIMASSTAGEEEFEHYQVSSVPTNNVGLSRMNIDRYIKIWIEDRKEEIETKCLDNPFPIIFVSSEGGGSRAGLWAFLIHSYLYDKNPDYFNKYLFSLTGASGGNVGNSMFVSTAYQNLYEGENLKLKYNKGANTFKYKASEIYSKNYLSSSLAALFGRDLFVSITGFELFHFKDRANILEKEWEKGYNTAFKTEATNPLGKTILSLKPQIDSTKAISPLLILNTTHLQTGEYTLISPVTFNNNESMNVFSDFINDYSIKYSKDSIIKTSTAMLLNARFPYVSPVGKVKEMGQYADAGYYDNIGGVVNRRLKQTFKTILYKDYPELIDKIEIRELVITNKEKDDIKEPKKIGYSSQLEAPLNILINATFGHPEEGKKEGVNKFIIESERTYINIGSEEPIEPILPLGRYLSDNAIKSLEKNLLEKEKDLDRLLHTN